MNMSAITVVFMRFSYFEGKTGKLVYEKSKGIAGESNNFSICIKEIQYLLLKKPCSQDRKI